MKQTIVLVLLLLNSLPLLSGCWNQKELTDLAIVIAMGVDKGKDKRFDVTFQLVNPGNVSSGQNGGGQGLPIAVYKSSGDTLTEAARNATKKISRRLYYAHANLLVISEELAREGILNIIDALERDPEFRTTTEMIIAKDTTAEEVVTTLTILDKLPVTKITKELQNTEKMLGENIAVNIDDFVAGLISTGKNPIVSGYMVSGDKRKARKAENLTQTTTMAYLEADGLALFKHGKLIGWMKNKKARGVVWVLNKIKSTDINIDWKGNKAALNITPIRSKTKTSVTFKNGKPAFQVLIKEESIISEVNTALNLDSPDELQKIEKKVGREIKKQVLSSIKEAQRQKCDVFGFGEKVHLANHKLWNKMKNNWDELFASAEVSVKVKAYNRRAGVRRNPFWDAMNQ
ncbi:Ger(x)C family spore germination protein [Neobacillus sp. PS3-40]|uniref:Ger(x)C family spore germination protein n=1 Tax=Neobacillus sp. PS3-40 TaxID=3070679 RepID=UPI0027E12294|nr:Ger(x)C family spore germination protein [Neobacillus sp. PS3-40]WML44219.1 Ger(x)C family spore germination protein [Neobacillus sp. PS3-40]